MNNGKRRNGKIEKMKIKATKVVNKNGDEMYRIDKVIGVADRTVLPDEYLRGDHIELGSLDGRPIIVLSRGKNILEGSYMTRAEFEASLLFIHQCGNRLHEIQKKIGEKRKLWKGKEEYEI